MVVREEYMSRKDYKHELNKINETYHELKLQFEKLPNSVKLIEKLNKTRRKLITTLEQDCADDLMRLNQGKQITIRG